MTNEENALSAKEGEMLIILDGLYGAINHVIRKLIEKDKERKEKEEPNNEGRLLASQLSAWVLKPLKEIITGFSFEENGHKLGFFRAFEGYIIKAQTI